MKSLYKYLSTPETSGRKIGLFRTLTAIFGGLIMAYLGMTLFAFLIPTQVKNLAVISIMLNTFIWAICTTWIALSFTKLEALLKFLIPTTIFCFALYILY